MPTTPRATITADLGHGQTSQELASWSITRALAGGGLPGQARAVSGFAVASGTATVTPEGTRSPWSMGPVRPGGTVSLDARADVFDAWAPVARMAIRSVSGSAKTPALELNIVDDLGPLRRPATLPAMLADGGPMDAADVIVRIAEEAGVPHDVINSGCPILAVIPTAGTSRWEVIQDIARCTLGAAWLSETGVLTYRPRQMLSSGPAVETIVADTSLEDVPWSLSTDDVAPRVEITFTPPEIQVVDDMSAIVWESSAPIVVPASATVRVENDIDGTAAHFAPWLPAWSTDEPAGTWSRWLASTDPENTTRAPDDALSVTTDLVNSSRIAVSITNRTSAPLYIHQGGSTPGLTVRANVFARRGAPQTLSRGPSAELAPSTLTVDLGTWVQDVDTATQMLLWLAGNVAAPLPILRQVRVVPNLDRRLGHIVIIRDPRVTQLAAKAIITGISMTGTPGSLVQNLNLQILGPTFFDFNSWLIAEDLRSFGALNDRMTALGIGTFAELNTYITTLLGA